MGHKARDLPRRLRLIRQHQKPARVLANPAAATGEENNSSSPDYRLRFCSISDPYVTPGIYPNFITAEQAAYIISHAEPHLKDSVVMNTAEQPNVVDKSIRTSKQTWISKSDPTVAAIIQKACDLVNNHPFEQTEEMQVVRYEPGEEYKFHHDSCCNDNDLCRQFVRKAGHRMRTVLIYLTDDFEGGETEFPEQNLKLKPEKHSAVVFHTMNVAGDSCHPLGRHGGLPVTSGVKWIANVWLRSEPVQ